MLGKGRQIENTDHISALVADRRNARAARGCDRILNAVPVVAAPLNELVKRGASRGDARWRWAAMSCKRDLERISWP